MLRRLLDVVRRQAGQDHGRQRDREDAHRKLDQPVGVVHPGDAAGRQERGHPRPEQQRDLGDRRAEDARQHQAGDARDPLFLGRPARRGQEAEGPQAAKLRHELHDAGHEHAHGEHGAGRGGARREPGRERDHDQVEQHRVEGRGAKAAIGVKHPGAERGQRDEEDVGEGPAQHADRELVALRIDAKAGRKEAHDRGRTDDAGECDDQQHEPEPPRHAGHEATGGRGVALQAVLGDDRHEGLAERSFARDPPQEIRDPEGHLERVHERAGPEEVGIDHVADEATDPAEEGHRADDTGIAQEAGLHRRPPARMVGGAAAAGPAGGVVRRIMARDYSEFGPRQRPPGALRAWPRPGALKLTRVTSPGRLRGSALCAGVRVPWPTSSLLSSAPNSLSSAVPTT